MCSAIDIRNGSSNLYNLLMEPALGAMHNYKSKGTLKTYLLRKGLVHMYWTQQKVKERTRVAMCSLK